MIKRTLGNSGISVAPLMLGGNVFGWTIDQPTSFHVLDCFVQAGLNFIDTADVYSRWKSGNQGGESESIIGKWHQQRGNRHHLIIATKVGSDMGLGKKCLGKKYILEAAEASLHRLQTDYIDLYQTHWDDDLTPVDETLEAYSLLIRQGKVRAIGASNLSPQRLQASLEYSKNNGIPRYESFQPQYNLCERDFEKELAPFCLEHQIGVINYYSLASGFLTGKYRTTDDLSKSARGAGVRKYLNEKGFRILAALDTVAKEVHSSPGAVAIAWLLAKPFITAPIASATSTEQLNVLVKATEIELRPDAMALLDKASS